MAASSALWFCAPVRAASVPLTPSTLPAATAVHVSAPPGFGGPRTTLPPLAPRRVPTRTCPLPSASSADAAAGSGVGGGDGGASGPVPPASARKAVGVPLSVDDSVDQAIGAVKRAAADGQKRQILQLVLPLVAPSLLDDWPGGIEQQLKSATPLVSRLLKGVSNALSDSGFTKTVLSEEDAVVQWDSPRATVVIFPTADTLATLRQLAEQETPLLLVNPQWQPGQVVSDFGFGQRRKEAEEFLRSFILSYSLSSTRIRGANVSVVRSYPSEWCVYSANEQGEFTSIGKSVEKPTYKEIEGFVKSAEGSSEGGQQSFFERIAKELKFLKDSK